ncbi:unnamed protein product [Lactuca saligna]|uniref:Uncharacterized protein n=1 Tax=Lactuca saligna TaxID=75948 RepID=A0AA35ZDC8_LACSI|nr:unnamed protein product [Lactuca saligna]
MNRSATYHHLRNLPQPPQVPSRHNDHGFSQNFFQIYNIVKIFREDKILSKLPVAIIQSWYQRQGYVKSMADLIQKELQTFWSPDEASSLEGQEASVVTEYVIKILGLEVCADTVVGDEMFRDGQVVYQGNIKERSTAILDNKK